MLQSNLPSDKRRPGTYHTFDDTSGARGLVPVTRSVACVGIKTSTGTLAVNTPQQVFNEAEADTYAGVGSELSLMVRQVFAELRAQGASCQVWIVAVAAPVNAAATRTLTFTGPATAAGDAVFQIAGRTIHATVKVGDSANTIAATAKAAIDVQAPTLPITAGVASAVVTTTNRVHGVNGNDVVVSAVSAPAGVTIVAANGTAGAGVASLVSALDSLGSRDYLAIAVANHLAQDVTDIGSHMDAMWASGRKRWRHAFMGENGSLATATTLASPANRKEIIIGSYESSPSLPCKIAASLAALSQSKERPSYNYDGAELQLYPPPDASVFSDDEVETAILGGVTPLTITDAGKAKMERLVTTKATLNSAAFENLRDYAVSATSAYTARQVDAKLAPAMKGKNLDSDFLKQLRDLAYSVLKQMEVLGDLQNVDLHAAELKVGAAANSPSRALVEIPESVVPNCHQIDVTHRLFVEAATAP